jgi:UDP-N-acetylmuramoyl-tripeptide--D-alanyl-D-alanine ligase
MPALTFAQIAELTAGEVLRNPDLIASSVVIDSREVRPDSVFFAIKGERLDGHQFLGAALETARGAVVSDVPEQLPADRGLVRVDDTTAALQQLARGIRERFPFTLIAVTGSAGKTTTKEMIATLSASERRTFKSWGNFNNLIGNPLCIDNTPDGTEVVVSEMGMNHKGEIAQLASLTHPDVGVYTNIGPVHIEFFGTIEKIAEAKKELLENVKADGTIIVNNDDEHVVRIARDFPGRTITYGIDCDADYHATGIHARGLLGTSFTLKGHAFDLSLPGRHNLENLLAAIAATRAIGISWDGITRGIGELKPAHHRGVLVAIGGARIYDDTYNSNPYAVARAIELLRQADSRGRRIAVLGDMLELGEKELEYHRETGRGIPASVDIVIGVGRRSKALLDGAREAGFTDDRLRHFADAEAAGAFLRTYLRDGDLVLIKASRGIGLDRIISMLDSAGDPQQLARAEEARH